jgi:hypothetical protein
MTINRVAGSRISAFFDFGDQPNDEVAYLSSAFWNIRGYMCLRLLSTRLKQASKTALGIVLGSYSEMSYVFLD